MVVAKDEQQTENVIEYKNKCYHMKCYLIFIIVI